MERSAELPYVGASSLTPDTALKGPAMCIRFTTTAAACSGLDAPYPVSVSLLSQLSLFCHRKTASNRATTMCGGYAGYDFPKGMVSGLHFTSRCHWRQRYTTVTYRGFIMSTLNQSMEPCCSEENGVYLDYYRRIHSM